MTSSGSAQPGGPVARLWAGRAVWVALAALALWLWGHSTVVIIREPRPPAALATDPGIFTQEDTQLLQQMGLPEVLATVSIFFFLGLDVVYFLLGGWIFWRRSNDWMALLLSFALFVSGAVVFGYSFEVFGKGYPLELFLNNLLTLLVMCDLVLLLYLFPDGKFVPSWTRFAAPVFAVGMVSFYLPLPQVVGLAASSIAVLAILATGTYARVYRYRRSTPVQRQQIKWIGAGLLVLACMFLLWFPSLMFFPPDRTSTGRVYYLLSMLPAALLMGSIFPITVAISILRNRLWHIDIYVNRTAVYAPLSGILMGLYAGTIRIFQGLFVRFTGEQSDFSILFSTLVLAGVFWPLRQRLQGVADRYFKETPDPSKGLRNFETQMRAAAELADVGHTTRRLLDETVAAFHAESGAVFLQEGSDLRLIQTAGAWSGTPAITVPLQRAETRVGELALGPRHKGRDYTSQDQEMLRGIAEAAAQTLSLRAA